jgi:two-component system response regulator VicR
MEAGKGTGKGTEGKGDERTVLILDDEAATRALLRKTVETLSVPCRVVEATDVDEAIEVAHREQPALALVDIVLPGSTISGVLVCRELLKLRGTEVVIVSGQATDSIIESCLEAGVREWVRKPFSVEELKGKLEEWLAR